MNPNLRRNRAIFFFLLPIWITLILWLLAKDNTNTQLSWSEFPRLLSQLTGLVTIVLLSFNYILSSRIIQLEKYFGGLDKVYKLHGLIGKVSLMLIILHPTFYVINKLNINIIKYYFIPFYTGQKLPTSLGILAFYLYIILVIITIFRFLPYELWKLTHKFLGIPFIFASYHALAVYSDARNFIPLFIWLFILISLGTIAYLYKTFLYDYIGPRHLYVVTKTQKLKDIYEIYLKPLETRINFEPGQFAFLSFINNPLIPKEHHPFSISSPLNSDILRFSFKEFGDYTHALKNAKKGDRVYVFGPYGKFTSFNFSMYKKQIWIAGGIGVTPFLSMLAYEAHNQSSKNILFYYNTKNLRECVYKKEIEDLAKHSDDKIKIITQFSDTEGYLTFEKIQEDLNDNMHEYIILLCGPQAMTKNLTKILIKNGIKKNKIFFEEFHFV
jgi:predicted ferric reductase